MHSALDTIAHAGLGGANVLVEQLGALDGQKGQLGLPRERRGEQRLAAARGPVEQHAGREAQRRGGEEVGVLARQDDLRGRREKVRAGE